MTASTAIRNWRNACRPILLAGLCLVSLTVDAATRVRVMAAPPAALAALRSQVSDIEWLSGDVAPVADADITLVWQSEGYARATSQFSQQPILLLAQSQAGLVLRSQDAALIWAPALAQQVQLARQIRPGLQRIGILYRQAQRAEIEALLQKGGSVAILARAVDGDLSARAISELAQRVDILIASNDEQLFNRDSAKLVLLTAYRHQRAWIGPTPAFVSAGALATHAVAKETLLQAIVEKVRHWQQQGRLGGSMPLPADEVVCNAQVARSLGLALLPAVGCRAGRP